MNRNAKVSLTAVTKFRLESENIKGYSRYFSKGIDCIEIVRRRLCTYVSELKESKLPLQAATQKVEFKIRELEVHIIELRAEIGVLKAELMTLEARKALLEPFIVLENELGEEEEVNNTEYDEIENRINGINGKIDSIVLEINAEEAHINNAKALEDEIFSQLKHIDEVVSYLENKIIKCQRLIDETNEVKEKNDKNSTLAIDKLKAIERIVTEYLHLKLEFHERDKMRAINTASVNTPVSNDSVNKTIVSETRNSIKIQVENKVSKIKEVIHHIKYDDNGRIIEYDGRRFGGKYTSYKDRLDHTINESRYTGEYEGERGESKFLPSNYTAEGLKVKNILSEYHLDGIVYLNAEPDFEECAEAVILIPSMTSDRTNNFSQADLICAKVWTKQKKHGKDIWNARDVLNYRKTNRLTWHEKCDTETMVLVRREINEYFKHSGGVAECKMRDHVLEGDFDE